MQLLKLKDETEQIEGVVAEGFIDIRFVKYYTNEFGTYLSEILYENISISDCFEKAKLKEFKRARLIEIFNLAKKYFPKEEKIYYEAM